MAKSTVSVTEYTVENEDGSERTVTQYRTTVPKSIAEAMRLGGAEISWEVKGADALRVSVKERDDDE